MYRQADVTLLAAGHPAALAALHHGGESTAVLEEDDLFTLLQCLAYA